MARLWGVLVRSFMAAGGVGLFSLATVLVYRHFKRTTRDLSLACHGAAAIAVTLGILGVIGGIGHSAAVVSLALKDTEPYGSLVILRFTTGAMLLYSGVMNIALYRAIRAGRRWALGIGLATGLLFWSHLVLVLPFPGTGGTVPGPLGAWSVYLLWLGAAAFASRRRDSSAYRVPLMRTQAVQKTRLS